METSHKRFSLHEILSAAIIFSLLLSVAGVIAMLHGKEQDLQSVSQVIAPETRPLTRKILRRIKRSEEPSNNIRDRDEQLRPSGSEPLPRGIVRGTSNLEMEPMVGNPERKEAENGRPSKSLLAIPVGIKNKAAVDKLVSKFPAANFAVVLFHYDGAVEQWSDLEWSSRAVHVSALGQTKWWFAKRFLHPDVAAEYDYVFLWDEDVEVDNFDPLRYLEIVKKEGLEISQPALDRRSEIHHGITARVLRPGGGDVHRRFYRAAPGRGSQCDDDSTGPPCTGWVEVMVPVFSRAAWRCTWYMVQNELVHAWGLDYKLGYCAQGDRTLKVGVVNSEYILHRGVPTLGDGGKGPSAAGRIAVRRRSYAEMQIFNRRWKEAAAEDESWTDPYPQPATAR